jgi:hypothetical protein
VLCWCRTLCATNACVPSLPRCHHTADSL